MDGRNSQRAKMASPKKGISPWIWVAPVLVLIAGLATVWATLPAQNRDGTARILATATSQARQKGTSVTLETLVPVARKSPTSQAYKTAEVTGTPIALSATTITIGIDLPVSGGERSDGVPTFNGMQLAIDQANDAGGVTLANGKNYRLESHLLDDVPPGDQAHDPAQSSKNVDAFISDPNVMVVLGPFNSVNARAMMPKLNNAGLCQVSPSNTNEKLTNPEFGETENYRPTGKITYFRVSTADDEQGPATAGWVYNKLGLRKAYILDDTENFGKLTADGFEKRFKELGGAVLGHESVIEGTNGAEGASIYPLSTPEPATDFTPFIRRISASRADMVYYGGCSTNGVPTFRKQMKAAGLDIPLVGNDCIKDVEYPNVAGADANGTYSSVTFAESDAIETTQQFKEDYRKAYGEEPGTYSAFGYEAAGVAIDAIKRGGQKDRGAVCQALRNTRNYKGIFGETGFDANGDTTNRIVSFYEVQDGEWEFVDQLRIK